MEAICNYFKENRCRSCTLLDLDPALILETKSKALQELINSALPEPLTISPIESVSSPLPSRIKAKLSVTGTSANPTIGIIDAKYRGIELLSCPLHFPEVNGLLALVRQAIVEHHLEPYDIVKRHGELKNIIIFGNRARTEFILRFVLRSRKHESQIRSLVPKLQASSPQLKVVSINLQPQPAAILEGPEEICLTDADTIWDELNGVNVCYAPQSFIQVTPEIAERLYSHVSDQVRLSRNDYVLDLFCGVGGFLLHCLPFIKSGTGVELSNPSIRCANLALARSEASSRSAITFLSADVDGFLDRFSMPDRTTTVVNPPRRGLSAQTLERLIDLTPAQIIYSSCNPETLVRDLALLLSHYEIDSIKPFDMFPLTQHLEAVAVLNRRA